MTAAPYDALPDWQALARRCDALRRRGLSGEVTRALWWLNRADLVAELEAVPDEALAEVSSRWRDRGNAEPLLWDGDQA